MPAVPRAVVKYDGKDADLVAILANPPKQVCPIGKILNEHPNTNEIQAALDNPRWSAAQLAPVLTQKVGIVSASIISSHRNETCVCYRGA